MPVAPSPPFTLKRALYFVMLAEELHFGRAAARLFIAQPGLSQQIKALEAELGVRLVDRGRRETRLTPAGERFHREAARLLAEAEDVAEGVRALGEGRVPGLTIGYSRSTTYLETTELVRQFRTRHPEIEVRTTMAWTSLNIELLRSRNVDVVFVRPPIEGSDVEILTLLTEEHVAALPPGHRLIDRPVLVPADLADEDVVLWPRRNGPSHYDRIIAQIWGAKPPRVVLEETDDKQIMLAVSGGTGITILEMRQAMQLADDRVTIRRFADPVPTCDLGIAWRREDHAPGVEAFIAFCQERTPLAHVA